jgi:hypothetical protein
MVLTSLSTPSDAGVIEFSIESAWIGQLVGVRTKKLEA